MRGVSLGRVTDIVPGQDIVEVRISVNASFLVYEDARAEIQVKELMGGKQVELYPGSSGRPVSSNFLIPGNASMDFSTSFSAFGQVLEEVDVSRTGQILDRFDRLAGQMESMLDNIDIQQIQKILAGAETSTAYLNRMLVEVNKQQYPEKISQTIEQTHELLESSGEMMTEVKALIHKADSATLPQLNETFASVNQLLDQLSGLEELLNGLQDEEGLAHRLINDQNLSHQLDTTLLNLNKVLEQIHSQKNHRWFYPKKIKFRTAKTQRNKYKGRKDDLFMRFSDEHRLAYCSLSVKHLQSMCRCTYSTCEFLKFGLNDGCFDSSRTPLKYIQK